MLSLYSHNSELQFFCPVPFSNQAFSKVTCVHRRVRVLELKPSFSIPSKYHILSLYLILGTILVKVILFTAVGCSVVDTNWMNRQIRLQS